MSSAIGFIIYGLNLTSSYYASNSPAYDALKDITDSDGEYLLSDHIENETSGFHRRYSGNGDQPQWFGIQLGMIDECNEVDGEHLRSLLEITPDLQTKYQVLVGQLEGLEASEPFMSVLKAQTPKTMILWGSS